MVLHAPEIRELLDLRVFVELDADLRALRRMLRNMERGQEPKFIAEYYIESARVGHERFVEPSKLYADFILRGDTDFERAANLLAAEIYASEAISTK
jgi:uridine kinase